MKIPIVALVFVLTSSAVAQFPLVRSIEVRTGQRRPAIERVVQDAQGLLWVSSDAGLLRTDGERVEVMYPAESDHIVALASAVEGVIAATAGGMLVHCTGARCDTLAADTNWRSFPVTALAMDAQGTIWIGTYGRGLVRISGGAKIIIDANSGVPDDHVNDLDLLPDGRVVVATDQGLALCRGDRVEAVFGEAQGAPDNLTLCVDATADGTVWAGTDRRGVFLWKLEEGPASLLHVATAWSFGPVRCVRASGGMVWAGTEHEGPIAIDLSLQRGTYRSKLAAGKEVLDLLVDNEGAVWWCNGTELLHRADPAILFVPEHEGLDLRRITALCTDAQGRIWFATADGLFNHVAFFSEERTVTRVEVPVDARAPIVSLAADANGNIWAGTFGNGVFMVRSDGGVEHFTVRDGLSNDNVLAVRSGAKGMWLATLEGITLYDAKGFHALAPETGFVFDVAEQDGLTYAAADGRGVWVLNGSMHNLPALGQRSYYTLIHDDKGALWTAGPGTGFCSLSKDTAVAPGADRPPFDAELFALGRTAGRLIAFGSTGVLAFDPVSGALQDVTATFGLEGISSESNVATTDASGALWFACSKGLARLRPTAAHFDEHITTAILSIRLGDEELPVDMSAQVPHDHNTLTVRFTGLHYADPSAIRFEYRLLGLDETVMRTRDREVGFSALPPGEYTFGLRAFTGEGPGDAPWQEVHFVIANPWWRTPWAIGGGALVVALTVLLVLRTRERRIRYHERMEQEKVRFQLDALRSQVDPHFLFNSFNALVELIESDPAIAVEHVDQLSIFFRNILQVRDRERITLEEELRLLENYFALEQRRFGAAIGLEMEVRDDALRKGIVPLTLQLLVENALKHNVVTGGDVFIVTVRATNAVVEVSNPLRPRLTAPRSTGFGIDSITRRYAALTDRPVEVLHAQERFIVRIPLIDPA